MEVILTQDVFNVGRAGEVVKVKGGYGRNYLIPRGMALVATRGNVAQLEHHKRAIARDQERIRVEHEKMAAKLDKASVSVARKVGAEGKLFGSVGTKDISEALAAQNIQVDRRLIQLSDPLRDVGTHEVEVRFSPDVSVSLKVNVVGI